MQRQRLGINIDHVATLRNARGGAHPDVLRSAEVVKRAGADSITIHLREDRRHIRDADVEAICAAKLLPVNLEMAATEEMLSIALKHKPWAVCLVPEKRQELTTEGGLDVVSMQTHLKPYCTKLRDAGIFVSLFVAPNEADIRASKEVGAQAVEIHTGTYCDLSGAAREAELQRIIAACKLTAELGLHCHAGHGLSYENVKPIAAIAEIEELNIGHFLVGEALFVGLEESIRTMRIIMDESRV